jgi:nucleotidyltransferase substrate binding protein (TIGR01987 family)
MSSISGVCRRNSAKSRCSASSCDKISIAASRFHARRRLDEALALPKDPIVRDSTIQRFEISFELCRKFIKAYLEEQHNAVCTSPRTCFRSAFKHGIIDDDPFWIDLTVLRNYTVHTYNERK